MDMRRKDYFGSETEVKSLNHFFPVPKTWKEGGGFRMVYDATQSGLNDAVWAPWFAMPTIDSHLRVVETGVFMTDCDVREMFINFMLEPAIRSHADVYLSKLLSDEGNGKLKAYWERMIMDFGSSLYLVTKDMMVIEEAVRGLRSDI